MNYIRREITYPSCDGVNTVFAEIFAPVSGDIRGVVQLSHGMIDHTGRYEALADFFTSHGFVFAGNNHLGHGRTVKCASDLGFFAERDGYRYVIDDLKGMNDILRREYQGKPLVLLGHSMGSFIARLYTVKYPDTLDALIIHGTGGRNPAAGAGRILVSLLRAFFGPRHRSKFITAVAFGSYNSHYDKSEGANAWLTRDISRVADRDTDLYTKYIFTLSAYHDLFTMLIDCNRPKWFASFPVGLPTLVISGEDDPVGGYGKGVRYVHSALEKTGVSPLWLKIYPGARHELFNETNREEAMEDMLSFITRAVLQK